ncbi:MAG: hypothetical protein K2O75_04310 [Lactobacillus sp.]|uniref:hypothetical protein n=1 Tax=Lactobacillus sp. TaxID=1591 RepID=UPI0023BBBCBE|nr:hypothetical protein [Lactobacillus sp.]MDE7050075.1 hypothetical protein [Lactobacillus sp.]
MLSKRMKELLDMVYETPNTIDLAVVVQTPDFDETFISDNLRRSYQPARAEGLIFRLIGTFVQTLDLDYQEFIDVLKGDLEDDLFDVKAMKKLKRPSQKLSEDKFERAEKQVENVVDFAEKLVSEGSIGDYVLVVNYNEEIGDVFFHDTSDQNMSTYHDIQVMLMEYANRKLLNPVAVIKDLNKRRPASAKLLNKEAFEDRNIDGFKIEDFWQIYRAPYQGGKFDLETPESLRLEKALIKYSKNLQRLNLTYFLLFVKTDRYVYLVTPSFRTEEDLLEALVGYLTTLEVNMDFTDEKFKEISDMMLEEKSYLGLAHGKEHVYAIDLPIKREIDDGQEIRKQINDIFSELLTYQKMGTIHDFYLFANVEDNNFTGGMMEGNNLTSYLLNFVELLAYLTHMYPNLAPKKIIDLVTTKEELRRKRK